MRINFKVRTIQSRSLQNGDQVNLAVTNNHSYGSTVTAFVPNRKMPQNTRSTASKARTVSGGGVGSQQDEDTFDYVGFVKEWSVTVGKGLGAALLVLPSPATHALLT